MVHRCRRDHVRLKVVPRTPRGNASPLLHMLTLEGATTAHPTHTTHTQTAGDGHSSFTDKAITSPHGGAGAGAGATATDGAAEVDIAALPIQRKPTKPDFLSQARYIMPCTGVPPFVPSPALRRRGSYAYPLSREITDCLKPLCEARAKQIEALPEDAVDESVYLTRFHIRKVQCPVPSK